MTSWLSVGMTATGGGSCVSCARHDERRIRTHHCSLTPPHQPSHLVSVAILPLAHLPIRALIGRVLLSTSALLERVCAVPVATNVLKVNLEELGRCPVAIVDLQDRVGLGGLRMRQMHDKHKSYHSVML